MRRARVLVATLSLALAWGGSSPLDAAAATKRPLATPSKAKASPASRAPQKTTARKPATRTTRARPTPTPPPARPDRTLFQQASNQEKALRQSTRRMSRRAEWEKVAASFRTVVDRYPRSPYCDDALLRAGDLLREAAKRFNNRRYSDQALAAYGQIVDEYPSSSLGENALYAMYEMYNERTQTSDAREAAEKYVAAYPSGKRTRELKNAIAAAKRERPARSAGTRSARDAASATAGTASATTAPPATTGPSGGSKFEPTSVGSGHTQVYGVRFWSGEASTRVVIDLDRKVEIKYDRLQSPPRLFIDLMGTRLHPNLVGKSFPVGNAFLKQIRVGVNRENVVRVVIDFGEATSHNVFFLADPDRLVIDVQGDVSRARMAAIAPRPAVTPSPASKPVAGAEETIESVQVAEQIPVELPDPTPDEPPATATPAPLVLASPEVAPTPAPEVRPTPRKEPTPLPTPAPTATPLATPRPAATPVVTASAGGSPAKNRDGSYSLARQLGLGARRICLDAGHGGHDPGAIGRHGTQEKDVTLAVVLRLEKLIREELGADVVLTRDTDKFIPLEERTAIANASGADLFLSVHINSARNSTGRGLETYYLSFAKSAAAEELAARENAISQATMKDLNNLVKAIATNSKIDESRDFAGIIQRSNVAGLSSDFKGVLDRGVHTAPFYVLIGASMPSILTEVGFISNPEEERWLKSEEYQQKLAESLLEGVRSYLGQLNQSQASRLGGRSGVRVAAKGRRR